jgi:hypothetical protein
MSAPLEGKVEEPTEADSEQSVTPNAPSTPLSTELPSMPTLFNEDADNNKDDAAEPVKLQQQQPLKSTPASLHCSECLQKPL